MTSITEIARNASTLAARNSPAILTAIGVSGTIATAILAGKAAWRSRDIVDQALRQTSPYNEASPRDVVELCWKEFIPPAIVGTGTLAAIIMANRIGTRRTAAVTAAYAITERAYYEYQEKARELYGETKERKIRDDIAQDNLERAHAGKTFTIPDDGKILCMDAYSGRTFYSTVEDIKAAQNWVNYELLNNMHASLTDFYNRIGLSRTDVSDDVGWDCDRQLELFFTWGATDDQKPVCIVSFHQMPFPDYYKLH